MSHTLTAVFLLVLSFEACVGDMTDEKISLISYASSEAL